MSAALLSMVIACVAPLQALRFHRVRARARARARVRVRATEP
jgi:hypothetical protein